MSHNNSAAATTSTAAAAAQEAFHKAQEIAARLRMVSGGNNGSSHSSAEHYGVPPPPSEQMEQPAAVASAAANHKRKRWGVMPEEEALALNNSSKKASLITPTSSAAATAAAMAKHLFTLNTTAAAAAMTTPGLSTSSSLLLSLQNHANKVPEPVASNITKRFWVTVTAEKPAAHFVAFCRDQLAEIAGRHNPSGTSHGHGTSSIDQGATREDPKDANDGRNSTDDDTTTVLQISFKGKGATNVPPLPGMPEEPLHVAVVGPKHLVEEVESPVEDLLQQAAAAPTDLVAVAAAAAAREQALVRLSSTSFRDGGGGGSSNYYKPASVATLIGQLPLLPSDQLTAALVHHGGGAMDAVTQDVAVPNGVVGCVIGRGGENIARMQALTGCKVQIQKEHELQPGQTDRIITLSASSQAAVDECHRMIQETIADRVVRGGGGGAGSNMNSSLNHHHSSTTGDKNAIPSGHTLVEVLVPDADVGLIIGKMGMTIKQIQEQSGASIQVPKTGNVDNPAFRTLQITHPDSQGAEYAKQMVLDILKSKPSYAATGNNNNANNGAQQQQQTSIQIAIPDKDVGLCIGRQGCVIKHMQGTTNTRIQIPQQVANPGEQHRIATITGSAQGCQQVQLMIERIVAEQSSASVMSGYPFQQQQPRSHPQQQQYYAPQENQQGYSAEWAAYHAAQAAAAAAQQQQQSLLQQQQEASAAASAAASDYHEQFFRYSFYYGEEAARQYYGAWSPPVGTPNPYGVNPAGITPAPAAAPVAEAAPLQAVAAAVTTALPATANEPSAIAHSAPTAAIDPAEARETSRRHVSNLPAWMTKKD